jgi:hypothetical protein
VHAQQGWGSEAHGLVLAVSLTLPLPCSFDLAAASASGPKAVEHAVEPWTAGAHSLLEALLLAALLLLLLLPQPARHLMLQRCLPESQPVR